MCYCSVSALVIFVISLCFIYKVNLLVSVHEENLVCLTVEYNVVSGLHWGSGKSPPSLTEDDCVSRVGQKPWFPDSR